MAEKEFNLLDERWIRVIDEKCAVSELSLLELFKNAHLYKDLCGELPTQDIAVLRMLLAVLHTVFSRYDTNGGESPLGDPDDAIERWKELWDMRKFPEKPIAEYLEKQRENFYLFHPERPFYQCGHAKIGTEYTAAKLNGNLSESGNKVRLFSDLSGKAKETLSFPEAARWLIYVNAYDDTSAKPSGESKKLSEKLPSAGAGWLGKLGLICAAGDNLFETLVLNLIAVTENGELFGKPRPIWEREKIPDGERVRITMPDNLPELYTLQSRRLYLKKDGETVTGYYLLGGDFFDKENAVIEPMTIWRGAENKTAVVYTPRRHDPSKQFWRDFSSLITNSDKQRRPGIITWIDMLEREELITNRPLNLKIFSVQYGDKDFFVNNLFSDSLKLHASLISQMNESWQNVVLHSVDFCDEVSKKVWNFAKNVNLAAGGDYIPKENNCSAKVYANRVEADFYDLIDLPFREWLCSLDPEADIEVEREKEWRGECIRLARSLGREIISQISPSAIFGRNGYSAAKSYNIFSGSLTKLEPEKR